MSKDVFKKIITRFEKDGSTDAKYFLATIENSELEVVEEIAEAYAAHQNEDLLYWKKQALQLLKDLDLQAIGKELGMKPGLDIAKNILPFIKKIKQSS